MFGPCKVCSEKDLRIADLTKQVDLLQTLVFPRKETTQSFMDSLEANKILSGDNEQVEIIITDEAAIAKEADELITGAYENEQMDYI